MWATLLLLVLSIGITDALELGLCSTSNSGLSFESVTDQYMSLGLCRTTCLGDGSAEYRYAIVQSTTCWCSNELPTSSTDKSDCSTACLGYPEENCAGDGYFAYLDVVNPANSISVSSSSSTSSTLTVETSDRNDPSAETSATLLTSRTSASTSTSSTSTSSSSTSSSSTSSSSSSSSSSEDLSPSTTSSSESTSSRSSTSSTSSSRSSSSHSSSSPSSLITSSLVPSTVYSVTTVSGSDTITVKTVFVTPTPTESIELATSSSASAETNSGSSFFDSKGKVAGTFTAVGIVVAALICGLLYCCCCVKRTKDENEDAYTDEENRYSSDESLSKTPVLKSGNQSLKRDNSSKSIFSLLGKESAGGVSRTLSRKKLNTQKNQAVDLSDIQMFPITEFESNKHDSRLEPFFLQNNLSLQTFGDENDYSRKLQIVNPDGELEVLSVVDQKTSTEIPLDTNKVSDSANV